MDTKNGSYGTMGIVILDIKMHIVRTNGQTNGRPDLRTGLIWFS